LYYDARIHEHQIHIEVLGMR